MERVSARREEPAWLREARLAAWARYEEMDLPDPYDEEWRRTDVRAMSFEDLKPLSASSPVRSVDALPAAIRSAWDDDAVAGRIFQHDSDVVYAWLADDLRARGAILSDLHTAAREHGDLVRKHLLRAVKQDEWKYLALNAALWSGGCFLYVPKGVEIELPVQISTGTSTPGLALFPRTVVVAEPHSKVTLIDETVSAEGGAKGLVSGAVELFVGDGARIAYYSVNRWSRDIYNFNTVRALIGRDAEFLAAVTGIGSRVTKMRVDAEMPQSGARTDLLGVTFGDRDQHFDYSTLQNHVGDHTSSDLQFKSALTDSASLAWYGLTRIHPGASASEANQTSRNLLLSDHAKATPIPVLEIEAYDVTKCSHGATAGPVDEDDLFYLQSRAIPRDVAEQMLIGGFFADVVDRMPNQRLRRRIVEAVMEKAGGGAIPPSFEEVLSA